MDRYGTDANFKIFKINLNSNESSLVTNRQPLTLIAFGIESQQILVLLIRQ